MITPEKIKAITEFFSPYPDALSELSSDKEGVNVYFNEFSTLNRNHNTTIKEFSEIISGLVRDNGTGVKTTEKIPETTIVKPHFDPAKELELSWINPLEEITAPPTFVEICGMGMKSSPAFTGGNFSLLIGKAKSKKTFLKGCIISAAVSGRTFLGRITGTLPEDKNFVLLFDTEQSAYHRARAVQRACKMIGSPNPSNFKGYGLKKYTPSQRLQMIEYAIYNTPNIGLIAIDGLGIYYPRE